MKYRLSLFVLLIIALSLPLAAQAQTATSPGGDSTIMQRMLDMTIMPSGDVLVVEQWDVRFGGEPSSSLTYEIADNGFTEITGWAVSQGDTPYQPITSGQAGTYQTNTSTHPHAPNISWFFAPTTDTNQTYTLTYTVKGAIRIYDDHDILRWNVVERQNRPYPIEQAQAIVHLPTTFAPTDLAISTYRYWVKNTATARIVDGQTVAFAADALRLGDAWEIRVQFPHGHLTATPPDWQRREDAERQHEEMRQAMLAAQRKSNQQYTILLAIVVVVGGGLVNGWLWWRFARNKPPDTVAEDSPVPPEPLPAGLAGPLIDEHIESYEITAALVDIAERGYLRVIGERTEHGHAFIFEQSTPPQETSPLRGYEQTLLQVLLEGKPQRRLATVRSRLFREFAQIKAEMYAELVREGYFSEDPDALRSRFRGIGLIVKFMAIMGAVFTVAPGTSHNAPLIFLLPLALLPFGVVVFFLSRAMHRTTAKGATAAAKWRGFKRSLEQGNHPPIGDGTDTTTSEYLAYAIAFGIHKPWLQQLNADHIHLPWCMVSGDARPHSYDTQEHLAVQDAQAVIDDLVQQVSSACDRLG